MFKLITDLFTNSNHETSNSEDTHDPTKPSRFFRDDDVEQVGIFDSLFGGSNNDDDDDYTTYNNTYDDDTYNS